MTTPLQQNYYFEDDEGVIGPIRPDPNQYSFNDQQVSGFVALASAATRYALANALGRSYDGDRDLYDALGYPKRILVEDYRAMYYRDDIAGKIVDLPAQDSWKRPPILIDGEWTKEHERMAKEGIQPTHTLFLKQWQWLVENRGVWTYLSRADRLSGIGEYGLLLFGVRGDTNLSKPLRRGSLRYPGDIVNLSAYAQSRLFVSEFDRDPGSQTFAMPKSYHVQFGDNLGSANIHRTRVLHIAEDLLEDEVYGRPRLERAFNRMLDLAKIVGGGAEATWRLADRGLHADIREGATFREGELDKLEEQIQDYIHRMNRVIRTQGVDLNDLGGQVVDPTGLFNILISLISAATNIPRRKLIGNEQGQLASSQDEVNWGGVIAARQVQHVEPNIFRPFVGRLIHYGALAQPKRTRYGVFWPSVYEKTQVEAATEEKTLAEAQKTRFEAGQIPIISRWRELGYSDEDIDRMLEDKQLEESYALAAPEPVLHGSIVP